jgi:ribosomal protein S18 acetylase RimI-like enzyme
MGVWSSQSMTTQVHVNSPNLATRWRVEEKHHGLTEIGDFWIDESFRRRGRGERLLRTVIEDTKQFFARNNRRLRKALVTTGEDNEPATYLYEKVGFHKSAALADLFGEGETELVYILTISF